MCSIHTQSSQPTQTIRPDQTIAKKENIINKIQRKNQDSEALGKIKSHIPSITEKRFVKERPNRVKCDSSHKGLGSTLEQFYQNGWFPIAYASRFLNSAEQKYGNIDLEL